MQHLLQIFLEAHIPQSMPPFLLQKVHFRLAKERELLSNVSVTDKRHLQRSKWTRRIAQQLLNGKCPYNAVVVRSQPSQTKAVGGDEPRERVHDGTNEYVPGLEGPAKQRDARQPPIDGPHASAEIERVRRRVISKRPCGKRPSCRDCSARTRARACRK
jgi:hypothetical protein